MVALAPTVTAVSPAANAIDVAPNTTELVAAFNEPMSPIPGAVTFKLTCRAPCVNPTGTTEISSANGITTLSLTLDSSLAPLTTYTATVTGFQSLATGIASPPHVWQFTTGETTDASAPAVSSTSPRANAVDVAINRSITASFSEPMNPLAFTLTSFTLTCAAGVPISGTVAYAVNGNVAIFTPATNLPVSTVCIARIDRRVTDLATHPMADAFVWQFTTGSAPDLAAPTVSSTGPADNAINVATNSHITASFNEPMDPLTIDTTTFTLSCPSGTPITGTVGYAVNGNVATFAPATPLPTNTICTARIAPSVTDVAANAIDSAVVWQFTTGVAADLTAPTVSSTSPFPSVTGVAINSLITASFSEAMDPLTITTPRFTVSCPASTPITGIVGYTVSGNVATFTPSANLPVSTICTARIGTGVTDIANNALTTAFNWQFTTGVTPDTTAPTVSPTTPLANATGVAINSLVTASFSEPMDPLTIVAANFTLACPANTPITGTVSYAVNGQVATFTPSAALPVTTICTARIATGAMDVANNSLASAVSWQFTTGVAPDTTAPQLSTLNPAHSAVGVCLNKTLNAMFNEAMDPLTITTATISLKVTAGASVSGTVSYDAPTHLASFDPTPNLVGTPATQYSLTIKGGSSGVKDVAGNALAVDSVSTFTTNASTCTTAPALGAAARFGAFGGTVTLTNDGLATVINGDIGVYAASSTITGFRDSGTNTYVTTGNNNGLVNGLIYTLTAPPGSVAGEVVTLGLSAASSAYSSISPSVLTTAIDVSSTTQCPSCGGVSGGADELAGRTLPPGVYRSTLGTYDIGGVSRTSANLTLDAGGDANAVWVFQTAENIGTLNVGVAGPTTPLTPIKILLVNGARAKNVFWYVPAGAVIGTGSTIVGTLLSDAAITFSTSGGSPPTAVTTTLDGRAISLSAGVTMTNTVINVPAP